MIVEYQALNSSGTMISDSLIVDEMAQVYAELSRRGLTPVQIKHSGDKSSIMSPLTKLIESISSKTKLCDPKRASKKELPFFTSQLSILLETGTPVAASLSAIEKQMTDQNWKQLIVQIRRHVEEGGTFASSTEMYPNVFDPVFTSMISAGEASGNLSAILNRLAELANQADRLRNKIISAMIYPVLLTLIAFSVMMVLTFFVLPRFAGIFEEMNVTLPATTQTMLAISDFARNHTLITLVMVASVITGIVMWFRSKPGRLFTAKFSLKIPIIGPLIKSMINSRIFRLMGLLVESNVPLLDALELTATSTKHFLYVELLNKVHANVLNGRTMHEVLAVSPLMPASVSQMVHTGEDNGQVGKVMSLLADYMDDRNETKISTLTSVMEPLILVFMGSIIGLLVTSLVLPMFDLSRVAGN